jgi:hypothetical protein
MKRNKRICALPLCALLALSLFSGCSTQTSTETENTTSDAAKTESTAAAPTAFLGINYAQVNDTGVDLELSIYLANGRFLDTFSADQISFGQDFESASDIELVDISDENDTAQIQLTLENTDVDPQDLNLQASLSLPAGAVVDLDGNEIDDLNLEQELVYNDAERSSGYTSTTFANTDTVVYTLRSGVTDITDFMMPAYNLWEQDASNLKLIFDFSRSYNLSSDTIYGINLMIARLHPSIIFINANSSSYRQLLQAANASSKTVQFVSGTNSFINYSSASVYDDIQSLINSGKLTLDAQLN